MWRAWSLRAWGIQIICLGWITMISYRKERIFWTKWPFMLPASHRQVQITIFFGVLSGIWMPVGLCCWSWAAHSWSHDDSQRAETVLCPSGNAWRSVGSWAESFPASLLQSRWFWCTKNISGVDFLCKGDSAVAAEVTWTWISPCLSLYKITVEQTSFVLLPEQLDTFKAPTRWTEFGVCTSLRAIGSVWGSSHAWSARSSKCRRKGS